MLETFWILLYNCIFLKNWHDFQSSPKSFRFLTDEHVNSVICANVTMLPILNSLLTFGLIQFYSYSFLSILSWKVLVKKMNENIQEVLILSWIWVIYLGFEKNPRIIPLFDFTYQYLNNGTVYICWLNFLNYLLYFPRIGDYFL